MIFDSIFKFWSKKKVYFGLLVIFSDYFELEKAKAKTHYFDHEPRSNCGLGIA